MNSLNLNEITNLFFNKEIKKIKTVKKGNPKFAPYGDKLYSTGEYGYVTKYKKVKANKKYIYLNII